MNDFPTAAAELIQGAATSRAVEPKHGEGAGDGHFHETDCLNCGTRLVGSHCHECGQAAHVHRSLGAFFHDLLHGVFHFEGKVWRTIPMLALRPGKLTREYINGKRASYVSPIALFLFIVFLTFAAYSLLGHSAPAEETSSSGAPFGVEIGLDETVANARAQITALETQLAEAQAAGEPTATLEEELAVARSFVTIIEENQGNPLILADELAKLEQATKENSAGDAGSDSASGTDSDSVSYTKSTPENWLEESWGRFTDNPKLMAYKLQANAYKFSWLLIPISVPFVWLLFPFSRRFHIYDHTIFVTYSIAFMLGLILLTAIMGWLGLGMVAAIPILAVPLHLYKHVKGTYGLGRVGALFRTWCLLWFAFFALLLFSSVLLTMAAG